MEFKVISQWEGKFDGEIILTNTGDQVIESWALEFDFKHTIASIWNAQLISNEDGYTFKNLGWNKDIKPGESVSIGFGASQDGQILAPQKYDLVTSKQNVGDQDYTIDFKISSDWGQGFNGEISITNNTEEVIEDWVLEFDFDRNIQSFWTAEIAEHIGDHYIIKNTGYNANIKPGETIKLGFEGNPGDVDSEPKNYALKEVGREVYYEKDTDDDGLPDWLEEELGTDPLNPDTDGDGLPDGYEYFILDTDPLKKDTDGNGILDSDEDFDNDGLTNLEEFLHGTNPYKEDTDGDGLSDGEEVYKYDTNPLKYDSDNDGLSDSEEILLGLNPLFYDTYNDGICDGDRKIQQTSDVLVESHDGVITGLRVEMDTTGYLGHNLEINNMLNIDTFTSDVVGLVGDPFDFEISSEFTEAKLTFDINQTQLKDTSLEDLLFLWYDEENHNFVEMETIIDEENSSVSTLTTHFSQYMLVNKNTWYKIWNENPYIDMAFNDLPYQPNNSGIAKTLPASKEEALALSKSFGESNYLLVETSPLDWEKAQRYCESYGGQLVAINSKEENDFVFNLTNQGGKLEYWIGGVWKANEQPTWITGEDFSAFQPLIDNWGSGLDGNLVISKSYPNRWAKGRITRPIENYTQGVSFVCEWNEDIVLKDTDNDGLPDAYEIKGMILANGQVVKTDPNKADTDGDGLKDGEEINPDICRSELRTPYSLNSRDYTSKYYFQSYSNPTKKDTDNDGLCDLLDNAPNNSAIHEFLIYETALTDYKEKAKAKVNRSEDFRYADLSKKELRALDWINWSDFMVLSKKQHIANWKSLALTTSITGGPKMWGNTLDMIDHFVAGTGVDYKSDVLTKKVKEHDSSKHYVKKVNDLVKELLEDNNGDAHKLGYTDSKRDKSIVVQAMNKIIEDKNISPEDKPYSPVFSDMASGLGICVDSLYGLKIELTSYQYNESTKKADYTLRFTYYDVFGLDSGDLTNNYWKVAPQFGILKAFRSWYILQHWDEYNGSHKPYFSYMSFDQSYSERLK